MEISKDIQRQQGTGIGRIKFGWESGRSWHVWLGSENFQLHVPYSTFVFFSLFRSWKTHMSNWTWENSQVEKKNKQFNNSISTWSSTFTVFANDLEKPKQPPNLQWCPQATSASLGNIPLLLLWCTAAIAKSKRSLLAGLVAKVRHQEPWVYKSESICSCGTCFYVWNL